MFFVLFFVFFPFGDEGCFIHLLTFNYQFGDGIFFGLFASLLQQDTEMLSSRIGSDD